MDLISEFKQSHFGTTKDPVRLSMFSGNTQESEGAWGDQESLTAIYENLETVYRCINFIALNLAKVGWKIVSTDIKGDKTDITENPKYDVLTRRPNQYQTLYEFKEEVFARLLIQGESFWHQELTAGGVPLQLFADWASNEVKIIPDSLEKIRSYILTRNGVEWVVPKEEVFMLKFFNPADTLRGLSPLRAGRHSLQLDLEAINFNKAFFKQGMKMSGVLSTAQDLKAGEPERFKSSFERLYAGTDNMHKVAVLWNGMKFDPIQSMSMNDAQFMELRSMNSSKILQIFGLSPEVLGIGSATYENVKYYRRMAWTETLQPLMSRLLAAVNQFLLPAISKDSRVKMEADYSNIEALKEDRSQKTKDYQVGIQLGAISRNEMRVDVFGKDAWEDPEMDIPKAPAVAPVVVAADDPEEDPEKKRLFI